MADGGVAITVNMNTDPAYKKLAKLNSDIKHTEETLSAKKLRQSEIIRQLDEANNRTNEARESIKRMNAELAEAQSALDIKNGGGSQLPLDTFIEYNDRVKELPPKIAAANAELEKQVNISNRLSSSLIKVDDEIARGEAKLEAQTNAAGELEKQMAGAASASSKMPAALENAAASMEKFTNRIKGLAKRVFVFTLITRALRALRTWLWDSIKTNDQVIASLAQLKGALLTLAQPILNVLIPAFTGLVNILTSVVMAIAKVISLLFGVDFAKAAKQAQKNLQGEAGAIGDVGSAAEEAEGSLAGFDEINTIQTEATGGGGGGGGGGGAGGITPDFSMWDDFSNELGTIEKIVLGIGAALATWKVAKGVSNFLKQISGFELGGGFTKIAMLATAGIMIKRFVEALDDIVQNGANFSNVTQLIGEFVGAVGTIAALLGHTSFGGALVGISGLADIARAIKGFVTDGINWENVTAGIEGIGKVLMAIGLLTPYKSLVGAGMFLFSIPTLIDAVKSVVHAIQTGDWSNVDWAGLVLGVTASVGGIIQFFQQLRRIKGATAGADATTTAIEEAATSAGGINTAMGSTTGGGLFGKLKTIAVNMGMGIVIIGEAAVAAGLIVAAIWGLGALLEQVGKAWEPVIENGGTVAIAIGVGTGILAAVGAATYGLGTLGKTAALNIGVGTLILAELGVATGLFIAEIWAIGKGLDEIGRAWQPVLDNGDTIKTGILTGTGLLTGIGVVTAALGAVTIGTAGALPLAIGVGTAVLVELAAATVLFTESLVDVADEMTNELAPALSSFNEVLPGLTENMSGFKDYMGQFAGLVVEYSADTAVAGIAATIDTIIGWFTKDPLEKLKGDVEKTYTQATDLNEQLALAVPALEIAYTTVGSYYDYLSGISDTVSTYAQEGSAVSTLGDRVDTLTGYFDGDPLGTLADTVEDNYDALAGTSGWGSKEGLNSLLGKVIPELATAYTSLSSYVGYLNLISETTNGLTFTGISEAIFVDMTGIGSNLVAGFSQGIANAGGVGSPVINGLNDMLNNIGAYDWYSVGTSIGTGIVNGMYNIGQPLAAWGQAVLNEVQRMFAINSPSRVFRDEVGYYRGTGLAVGLADSQSKIMHTVSGLSDAMRAGFATPWVSGFHINGPVPPIPRLAEGAVIPPNREFMAVLGDQRQGNNIEAPEALIRQIVRSEIGDLGGKLDQLIELERKGRVLMVDKRYWRGPP